MGQSLDLSPFCEVLAVLFDSGRAVHVHDRAGPESPAGPDPQGRRANRFLQTGEKIGSTAQSRICCFQVPFKL